MSSLRKWREPFGPLLVLLAFGSKQQLADHRGEQRRDAWRFGLTSLRSEMSAAACAFPVIGTVDALLPRRTCLLGNAENNSARQFPQLPYRRMLRIKRPRIYF